MFPIPDKYEDLQQKEHFARMGYGMYQEIMSRLGTSTPAGKLFQTVYKAQDDIFKTLQDAAVKANNSLNELKHKAK